MIWPSYRHFRLAIRSITSNVLLGPLSRSCRTLSRNVMPNMSLSKARCCSNVLLVIAMVPRHYIITGNKQLSYAFLLR